MTRVEGVSSFQEQVERSNIVGRGLKAHLEDTARRFALLGTKDGQTGAVTVVQRTSSDLRLNPHYHLLALDGVYTTGDADEAPTLRQPPNLTSQDVADILQVARVHIVRFLTKQGVLAKADGEHPELLESVGEEDASLSHLAAAAVSGQVPAGPELRRRPPLTLRERGEVRVTGALLAGDGGFTLHAATIARDTTTRAVRPWSGMCYGHR